MKQRDQPLLYLRGKINQEVAAHQQIEPGERRIHNQVLRCKYDHLTDLFTDPVIIAFLNKKAIQTLRRNILGNIGQVDPLAGFFNRIRVQVGGKNLHRKVPIGPDLPH